jgi:hypothetical protein
MKLFAAAPTTFGRCSAKPRAGVFESLTSHDVQTGWN